MACLAPFSSLRFFYKDDLEARALANEALAFFDLVPLLVGSIESFSGLGATEAGVSGASSSSICGDMLVSLTVRAFGELFET